MNDTLKDLSKGESREELVKLYDEITKMSLEFLKTSKDKFPPAVTVILPGNIMVPLILDARDNIVTLYTILSSGPVSAVITMARGWAGMTSEYRTESFSLEPLPKSDEIFMAAIESAQITMTKTWRIQRDKKGQMIFPLGRPEVLLGGNAFNLGFIRRQGADTKN